MSELKLMKLRDFIGCMAKFQDKWKWADELFVAYEDDRLAVFSKYDYHREPVHPELHEKIIAALLAKELDGS